MYMQCITLYNYVLHWAYGAMYYIIVLPAQLVRRYTGKRTSEKSEKVTWKDVTQVVRYRCVNQ